MYGDRAVQPEFILKLAEAEFAAFLGGAEAGIGRREFHVCGAAWIGNLMSREWPGHNYPAFFRAITILTITQLVSNEPSHGFREARKGEKNEVALSFISV